MAIVTLYRRDDLSGNVKASDTKITRGDDGVDRTELENFKLFGGYTQSKSEAEALAKAYEASTSNTTSGVSTDVDGVSITQQQVYNLLPWLKKFGGKDADTLVDAYIKGFIESDGSATVALAEMRFGEGAQAYSRVFANIVDPDTGALKMTEVEYLSGLEDFNTTLVQNGLAGYAAEFGKEKYADLVGKNVAMPEFALRVKTIKGVLDKVDTELKNNIINNYNTYYASQGVAAGLTEEGLLAIAFDPNLNSEILTGRMNASQLGAVYEGITDQQLGLGTVQKLMGAGLQVSQAQKQFEVAALSARLLSSAARRQRRATTLSAENVLEAGILGRQDTMSLIQSIQNQIAAASSATIGAVKGQGGAVTGIVEAN